MGFFVAYSFREIPLLCIRLITNRYSGYSQYSVHWVLRGISESCRERANYLGCVSLVRSGSKSGK